MHSSSHRYLGLFILTDYVFFVTFCNALTPFLLFISVRNAFQSVLPHTQRDNIGRNARPNKLLFSASQMHDVFLHKVPLCVFREHSVVSFIHEHCRS